MKLISIVVPCYNSEEYLDKCVQSLLIGRDEVEVILVDDGSTKDRTPQMVDEYARQYPDIIKAVHQENKGHGGAIHAGLDAASGYYFKVVDSDDWLDKDAFIKVLDTLQKLLDENAVIDLFINNFAYIQTKKNPNRPAIMQYEKLLPIGTTFTWDDMEKFPKYRYILMHSVIFRTQLLRNSNMQLPEHTYYEDNIYVFEPFASVRNMYYLDVELYQYNIGRDDQSVNKQVMLSRVDQQVKITKIMIDFLVEHKERIMSRPSLYRYMCHHIRIMMVISSTLLNMRGGDGFRAERRSLWKYLRVKDFDTYSYIRKGILMKFMNLPGKFGKYFFRTSYFVAQKIFKFS